MKSILLILILAILALRAPAQKQKPVEVEVVEGAASRDDDKLTVDGRVKNVSDKPTA
ncbi:MAG: hypothetical protein WKF37_15945 [Bryobacteraceae bacterium]